MILHNHLDAAYLVAPEVRSRAGSYIYLGNEEINKQIIDGPITIITKIIKAVMSSAVETELAALYMNPKDLVPQ